MKKIIRKHIPREGVEKKKAVGCVRREEWKIRRKELRKKKTSRLFPPGTNGGHRRLDKERARGCELKFFFLLILKE